MRTIKIEKVTLNVGAGKDQNKLDKAKILLKHITGIEPVKTVTNKRIPTWGIRPGLPIGCKLTLRKEKAAELLKQLLEAKDNVLKESQFDERGNISFGIHEYIDIPNVKYEPKIGMMGFQICITLERPGFRIKKRSLKKTKVSKRHNITKQESIEFMKKEFSIKIGEQ
jgi:large subunit ribosomal protein L5